MSSKILFILHLPPPIHGAAMMGKYIQEDVYKRQKISRAVIRMYQCTDIRHLQPGKHRYVYVIIEGIPHRCV